MKSDEPVLAKSSAGAAAAFSLVFGLIQELKNSNIIDDEALKRIYLHAIDQSSTTPGANDIINEVMIKKPKT